MKIALILKNTINLDWRTVFRTYYLLAKINFNLGNKIEAKKFNDLALRAHPNYSLALKMQKALNLKTN